MITFFRNIFIIPELRKRIIFTFLLLAVYRIGSQIFTPGIDVVALKEFFESAQGTLLGVLDLFSGGNIARMTIFATGIMPYISASIILQLLQVVWPYLERISKEGDLGRKKITQYTRYGTVVIAVIQSFGFAIMMERMRSPGGVDVVMAKGWGFRLLTILTMTTGTVFIMWLGEQISERGIGNGISLIIFAGIVAGLVPGATTLFDGFKTGDMDALKLIFLFLIMIVVIGFIVFVEMGQRRIPISYAKRVQGRRMMGGQSTFLPLKVNTGGVIPIIFAQSVMAFPSTIGAVIKHPIAESIANIFGYGMPAYNLMFIVAIIFFTYFYISIIFNPQDVSDNLKKYGGFIPGIRAGKNTSDYIDNVLSKLTFVGALYLALVSIIPTFLMSGFNVEPIPLIGEWLHTNLPPIITRGLNVRFYFGGTSILIVVGVAMDTVQQIEAQLTMRNYESFSRKGRVRGRR